MKLIAVALAVAGVALADKKDDNNVQVFFPMSGVDSLVGTVMGSASSTTTYLVQCQDKDSKCSLAAPYTIAQGPTTIINEVQIPGVTQVQACSVGGDSAVCEVGVNGGIAAATTTTTISGDQFSSAKVSLKVSSDLKLTTPSFSIGTSVNPSLIAAITADATMESGGNSSASASGTKSKSGAADLKPNTAYAIGGAAVVAFGYLLL